MRVEGYVSKPVFVDASEQDVFKRKVSEVAYLLGLQSGNVIILSNNCVVELADPRTGRLKTVKEVVKEFGEVFI